MPHKLEKLIQVVYKMWKADEAKIPQPHPDEEALACFLEGKLKAKENEDIKMHLIKCDSCTETLIAQIKLEKIEEKQVPKELLEHAKNLVSRQDQSSILEILLKFKEKAIEILNTTGDILVGQELVPAPLLRSRKTKDFKDEVLIFKDFKDMRVELKIENNADGSFSLTVMAKEKQTQKIIKDLRVTLLKDDLELESYLADSGKVSFEHVLLGKYTVEISSIEQKLASILLDIKI